ncbi:hypothetical protein SDC9_59739 [bioreactor metagenome]|uniref:Secretion system C-terminal sorting domain-containing protein n=1 Tax=bioreactor metagenome TaxID=1076179 RepID=A0A644XAZ8_9ZZZZ
MFEKFLFMKNSLFVAAFLIICGQAFSQGQFELWGSAWQGGANDHGTIFSYNPFSDTIIDRFDFYANTYNSGAFPYSSPTLASNGKLYGVTTRGGYYNCGALYEFDPNSHVFNLKADFQSATTGESPLFSMIQAADGNLYGTTNLGGTYNKGTLFRYNISTNSLTCLHNFDTLQGAYPGLILQLANGKLYGVSDEGGQYNKGTIFEFDLTNNQINILYEFDGYYHGAAPKSLVYYPPSDCFYGVTSSGGINNFKGTIFKYNINTDSLTVIRQCNNNDSIGYEPGGGLEIATDNKIYGLTASGTPNSRGALFRIDPATDSVSSLFMFESSANGGASSTTPMQASDGYLYGLTSNYATQSGGAIFMFDIFSDTYYQRSYFRLDDGVWPVFVKLVEVSSSTSVIDYNALLKCNVFPNPASDVLYLSLKDCTQHCITLMNNSGSTVFSTQSHSSGVLEINISTFSPGLYFLKIENAEGFVLKRVVVER